MKRTCTCLALLALAAIRNLTHAAGPEADPNKEYWLSAADGPYLIYVASYRGDKAREMANQLVYQLRSRWKMPAYLYSRSEEERREQQKHLDELHAKYGADQRFKKVRIVDDFAVLVGHWKDMDAAHRDLDSIKKKPAPGSLATSGIFFITPPAGSDSRSSLMREKNVPDKAQASTDKKPFSQAFVTRNPQAPKDPAATGNKTGKSDPLWSDLNANEKYSLFKNRKPWTLVVQVYQGSSRTEPVTKPNVFERANPGAAMRARERQIGFGKGKGLEAASADAAKLVELLRDKGRGYEAFIFHQREATLVTVGGFNGPADPELVRLQKQLAGMTIGGTRLMDTPVAMEVPKQ